MHTEFMITANVAGDFFNHIDGCIKLNRPDSITFQDDYSSLSSVQAVRRN